MLCESALWRMHFCQNAELRHTLCYEPKPPHRSRASADMTEAVTLPEHSSGPQSETEAQSRDAYRGSHGSIPGTSQITPGSWNNDPSSLSLRSQISTLEVDIPKLPRSNGDMFLVPSSCKSICNNYSDLLIGGDQVLPLSDSGDGAEAHGRSLLPSGPFLQSSEIPPPMESLAPQGPPPSSRRPLRGDSARWRGGSGKDRSCLFQDGRPLSNSQLNAYLEQKLVDVYRQYMVESLVQHGSPTTVLASELILTSVDQITQQLTREQNLEAARAKDMVISCLLRVASDLPSGEISTPQLQISEEHP